MKSFAKFPGAFVRIAFTLALLIAFQQTPFRTIGFAQAVASSSSGPLRTRQYTYEIVHTYPHDRGAFTQGLLFLNGFLYESTGLNGHSSLRKVDLTTGKVLQETNVADDYFAEGLTVFNGKLYQLTWQEHTAFVYDLATFKQELRFSYPTEGWGLATDGQSLIFSDGTAQIRFLDPLNFKTQRTITALYDDRPLIRLNELEYIKGEIFANVWGTDHIVRIDPKTGNVLGDVNFAGLLAPDDRQPDTDVLNGIAYDPATDRIFVTGKHWPKLFEVRLRPLL
jgi:glutaminyl-peptide cyclotransferase